MMRRAVALAALVLMAGTGTAQAKADDSKADCKHGGFVSYVDPATGQPFVDQGTCVSHVVHGGELVPVAPPDYRTLTVVMEHDDSGTLCLPRVSFAGFEPDTETQAVVEYGGILNEGLTPGTFSLHTNADGFVSSTLGWWVLPGGTVTIILDGLTATAICTLAAGG